MVDQLHLFCRAPYNRIDYERDKCRICANISTLVSRRPPFLRQMTVIDQQKSLLFKKSIQIFIRRVIYFHFQSLVNSFLRIKKETKILVRDKCCEQSVDLQEAFFAS